MCSPKACQRRIIEVLTVRELPQLGRQRHAEEIKTFQDRSYIYRTITFDVLGQNEIAVESLWTEATRHIVEMDDSQRARGFLQGTMGIPQVVQTALQGGSLDSEKPLKRGGCLVILLLTGVTAVSSTLLALFQTWT